MATHTRETVRIQARLERAELTHLRECVAAMGLELERMREALAMADDAASMWETLHHAAIDARPVGLTPQGEIIILDRP